MIKKTSFDPARVKMQNFWLDHDTMVIIFESKINKIIKLDYRTKEKIKKSNKKNQIQSNLTRVNPSTQQP